MAGQRVTVRQRAAVELRADHERTNAVIAAAAGCDPTVVGLVRHQLEAAGDIPVYRAKNGWQRMAEMLRGPDGMPRWP